MVYVGDKKYACESCIKGHRSSTCRHIDRPLYEIKAKGRPVTQCEHCRQLRKTKQIHVKCTCGGKDELERIATREGSKSTPVPAFPNGLPEALRTPGMMHIVSDGSESEHSNPSSSHAGAPKRREKARERPSSRNSRHVEGSQASRATEPGGLVARAHPKDLRPVLPKASPEPRSPHGVPGRDYTRSSQQHASSSRMSEQPGHRIHDHAGGSSAMMSMSALGDSSQSWNFDIPLDNIPNPAWTPSPNLGDTFDVESFHALYGCGPACPCQRNFPYTGTTSGPASPPGPSYPSVRRRLRGWNADKTGSECRRRWSIFGCIVYEYESRFVILVRVVAS
uniref:ACE1-like transcription factor n=1 Tax=Ceriporiopsis subvermispora TaxID=42742 RepID=B6DXB8_CERSU|nr:ACE1-like transcription factor [Gelatoporia subvermispora]